MFEAKRRRVKLSQATLIVVASALLGVLVDWQAPGIERYAKDWLMRQRGVLPVPSDIVIAAIDEKSISAFGRFPWPRNVLAQAIDVLHADDAKVIAVDVLFPEATVAANDDALEKSITAAGNVVLAAQLVEAAAHGGPPSWLMPMETLAGKAAGVGHVNVQVEAEGIAREVAVQESDDGGKTVRALAIEAVRVGDRTPEQGVSFTGRALLVGDRVIPIETAVGPVVAGSGVTRLPTGRMNIDYIGPAGSFDGVTYSVADLLNGGVPAERVRGKYVLIGATAASLGDRVASPFVHQPDAHLDQHGGLMPGVEVLANSLNTILRGRFYAETGDFGGFLWAAVIGLITLLAIDRAQGGTEMVRLTAALWLVAVAMVLAMFLEFKQMMVFPPVTQALVSFASAAVMGLLWRSLAASSRLDESLGRLAQAGGLLASGTTPAIAERSVLPHGLEWKAQKVAQLNGLLVDRARFVDQALKSIEDGLLIATQEGRITFANSSAAAMLGVAQVTLAGQSLLERLGLGSESELLKRVVVDGARVERPLELRESRTKRYVLRLAAVAGENEVAGIVATLTDVTRQHELQQTKNDVISLVSHEMRTPLTAIQGMTELLANYDMDAGRRKEISSAINDEVKRLTAMITEYLDITRLESGATPLRKSAVKVEALLQRIVLMLQPVAEKRGIRLSLTPGSGLPAALVDPDLISRAVENLASNAIKYSPANTEVQIGAKSDGEFLEIRVADQGYGIPEGDLERVFEKFYRVPRVEDADVPGTGLGLALVREVAELHGGAVQVTSEVNASTTFTLRIPIGGSNGPGTDKLER